MKLAIPNGAATDASALTTPPDRKKLIAFSRLVHVWLGREGQPLDISCPHNYRRRGMHGVRLEATWVAGSGWCSSLEMVERFIRAVDAAKRGVAEPAPRRKLRRLSPRPLLRRKPAEAAT